MEKANSACKVTEMTYPGMTKMIKSALDLIKISRCFGKITLQHCTKINGKVNNLHWSLNPKGKNKVWLFRRNCQINRDDLLKLLIKKKRAQCQENLKRTVPQITISENITTSSRIETLETRKPEFTEVTSGHR